MGIAMGAQPIIGYNYGARKFERMKRALGQAIRLGIAITTPLWAHGLFAARYVRAPVRPARAVHGRHGVGARAYLMFIPILPIATHRLELLRRHGPGACKATVLTLTRQILFFIPLLIGGPAVLPLCCPWTALQSVWLAPSISDITSTLLVVGFLAVEWRRLRKLEANEALEETGAAS